MVAERVVVCTAAEQRAQIVALSREQARVELAVRGQAQAGAVPAKRPSHAGDHAEFAAPVEVAVAPAPPLPGGSAPRVPPGKRP